MKEEFAEELFTSKQQIDFEKDQQNQQSVQVNKIQTESDQQENEQQQLQQQDDCDKSVSQINVQALQSPEEKEKPLTKEQYEQLFKDDNQILNLLEGDTKDQYLEIQKENSKLRIQVDTLQQFNQELMRELKDYQVNEERFQTQVSVLTNEIRLLQDNMEQKEQASLSAEEKQHIKAVLLKFIQSLVIKNSQDSNQYLHILIKQLNILDQELEVIKSAAPNNKGEKNKGIVSLIIKK